MKARPDVIGSYTVTYDNQIVGFIVALDDGTFRAVDSDGETLGTFRKLKVAYRRVAALLVA
jgi:hypothetical protein